MKVAAFCTDSFAFGWHFHIQKGEETSAKGEAAETWCPAKNVPHVRVPHEPGPSAFQQAPDPSPHLTLAPPTPTPFLSNGEWRWGAGIPSLWLMLNGQKFCELAVKC